MILPMDRKKLKDRIAGCWLGKGIGGTLGMPFEGCRCPIKVSLDQMSGRMLPNDDLDLQLLWLKVLEEKGLDIRARHLARAAADHYECYPDEYGIARWNTARGWAPPLTGIHNNAFGNCMGAAIRSEIWACISPGKPRLAASLAREDALVDHFEDGVYAEMFLAALESNLFLSSCLQTALNCGFDHIPDNCDLAVALHQVRDGVVSSLSVDEIIRRRDRNFPSQNFTDVNHNLCSILLALLVGHGDIRKTLSLVVGCGGDTDCTAATCGSILGILKGASGFPSDLRTLAGSTLAFHPSLGGLGLPETLDELTERCLNIHSTWEKIPDLPLSDATSEKAPPPEDPHHWLILRVPVDESMSGEPKAIARLRTNPSRFPELYHCENGIHLDLTSRVQRPGDVLYLFTWLRVESACNAKLMACADAGITVWLNDREIINYHGRHPAIPAFHRTEGGATVCVSLNPENRYRICVRLSTGTAPLRFCLTLGDEKDRYIHPVYYEIPDFMGLDSGN